MKAVYAIEDSTREDPVNPEFFPSFKVLCRVEIYSK
jgi:hypothetical protein